MFKRIALFALTNLLVIATISIVISLLGIGPYLTKAGIDYGNLAAFCLIWGMLGSFISLLLSKQMAKWMMGVKILDPNRATQYDWLIQRVHLLAKSAGLQRMPEVGIYDSPEVNAFATGPSRSSSLVAVSTGLLSSMNRDELDGVLAHEVAHIQNGDMVTMTLIQGVINAFTLFLSRVIAFAISQNVKEESRHTVSMVTTILLDIVLSFLGAIVVCWFSRQREFRADRGSATLLGGESKMIAALKALSSRSDREYEDNSESMAALKISGRRNWLHLLATHPPLSERIQALQTGASLNYRAANM